MNKRKKKKQLKRREKARKYWENLYDCLDDPDLVSTLQQLGLCRRAV